MLSMLREKVKHLISPIVDYLIKIGVTANTASVMGLIFSIAYLFSSWSKIIPLTLLFLVLSGLFDALDGEIARKTGRASRRGALIDSTLDRVEDGLYMVGLLALGLNSYLVFLTMISSFMVSYLRAKADSFNINLEGVGIAERGDRIIIIALAIIIYYLYGTFCSEIIILILMVASMETCIERSIHILRQLE